MTLAVLGKRPYRGRVSGRIVSGWLILACVANSSLWAQADTRAADATESTAVLDESAASSPEALSAYARAATYQNNRAFDLAAEAWQRFLTSYPSDAKVVDAHYNLGVCYLELKQFERARASLQQALDSQKEFSRREDALLNLGWALYTLALRDKSELFGEADGVLRELLEQFPEGQYRDQAWFLRGEALYMQGKRQEAADAYQHVVKDHPASDVMPNGLYALGVTLEELQRYDEAAALYDRFLESYPDNALAAEVELRKAETLMQRGEEAAAETLFAELAERSGFAQADHARFRQASCVARQQRFADAARLFAALTRDFPESRYVEDARMAAARAYFRAEAFDEEEDWFEPFLNDEGPLSSEAAHWKARILLNAGDPTAALQLVNRFLPIAQQQQQAFAPHLLMDQADAMFEIQDRKRQAMELYAQLARTHADHALAPQALYNAAFAALQLKEYRHALSVTQEFIERYPEHTLTADVRRIAAECHLQLGDAATAAQQFGDLATSTPTAEEQARLRLRQAVALCSQQDYQTAESLLSTHFDALTQPSDRAEAYHLIGLAQFAADRFQEARQSFQNAMDAAADWREADQTLLYLSRAERESGAIPAAKRCVEQLLRDFPESQHRDEATYRLAEYDYALNDYQEAAQQYQRVIREWPDSKYVPYALYGLGWSELRRSAHPEAQSAFNQLLVRFPNHALAQSTLYARALARQQAGDYQDSLADLSDYLQGELSLRQRSDGLYVRGLCQVGLKRFGEAIESFQAVLAQHADYAANDKVLYELAWALKSSEQAARSVATFERLVGEYPESSLAGEAHYHVGEAHYEAGDYGQAVAAYRRAASRSQEATVLAEKIQYKLGWAHYQLGDYEQALAAFAQQLNVMPEGELSGDAQFMQGECYFKLARYDQALERYTQARERSLSSEQITVLTYLHAGQAAGQLQQWQESHEWLLAVAKRFPQSPLLLQIGFELAVAQQNLDKPDDAEKLFRSIADRADGELSARARFMLGEILYAKQDHVRAIHEFRKVMFGFDPQQQPEVAAWQAKAGFEAGQCAGILAGQQTSRAERQQYLELATRFFEYVQTRHQGTDEAVAAAEQLKRYGVLPR